MGHSARRRPAERRVDGGAQDHKLGVTLLYGARRARPQGMALTGDRGLADGDLVVFTVYWCPAERCSKASLFLEWVAS